MSMSGITRLHCQVFGYSHIDKITYLRPRFLPLFPYTHTYSVIEPSVDVIYVLLHTCNSVVVKPSPRIHLDFLKAWLDWLTSLTGRQFLQSGLELLPWLRMNSDINALSVPSQCKAKEFKILDCKHTDSTTLFSVDCKFQPLLKIFCTAFQESLWCSPALCKKHDVICISYAWNTSFQKFLVELIEVDICQQWR